LTLDRDKGKLGLAEELGLGAPRRLGAYGGLGAWDGAHFPIPRKR